MTLCWKKTSETEMGLVAEVLWEAEDLRFARLSSVVVLMKTSLKGLRGKACNGGLPFVQAAARGLCD